MTWLYLIIPLYVTVATFISMLYISMFVQGEIKLSPRHVSAAILLSLGWPITLPVIGITDWLEKLKETYYSRTGTSITKIKKRYDPKQDQQINWQRKVIQEEYVRSKSRAVASRKHGKKKRNTKGSWLQQWTGGRGRVRF